MGLALHVAQNLLLLHLGGSLHPFGQCLRRETVLVYLVHSVTDVGKVFHHKQGVLGQETREGHLLLRHGGQFGHNLYLLALVLGELCLHLEGADGVNLVAEEVKAEWILRTVGINVDDAAAHGKLSRLIHIVGLGEIELAQPLFQFHDVHLLSGLEHNGPFVEPGLRHHQFAQRLWTGHHIEIAFAVLRYLAQHLGAQYLVGCVALAVFHGASIGGRVEKHLADAEHLGQVVIEIAGFVGILQHKHHRPVHVGGNG